MIVYCCVIIGLLFLILINESKRYRNASGNPVVTKGVAFCIIALLALVAGLRYNVGTDYYNYYKGYEVFKRSPLELNDEPGIRLIARLAAIIYDDPATMMFLAAVITVVLMTVTIFRYSDCYWLSILLYIFLCSWHGCFNGVRQYLAASILFAGHGAIRERKLWKWAIIVFIASMFHVTAVVGILFYFYPRIKLSLKNAIITLMGVFVGINIYDKIFSFIGFLKNDTFDFEGVGSGYLLNSISPLRIAVAWIPVLFFFMFKKFYNTKEEKINFYVNMSLLHAALMTMVMNSTYLGRIGIYTGIFNTLTWPILVKRVEPISRRVLIVCMLGLYAVYWSTEAMGASLVNFQWIFQR